MYNCMTGMFVRRAMILFVGQKEEEEKDTCRQADITTTTTNGSCRFYRHAHMRARARSFVHYDRPVETGRFEFLLFSPARYETTCRCFPFYVFVFLLLTSM